MAITFGGVSYPATFNGLTPIVFSRAFSVEKSNGAVRPKDINEDVSQIIETMQACGMPPMVPLLEIAYACIKTADSKFDDTFDVWVEKLPQETFDLQAGDGWAADVMKIVEDNFFPSTPDGVDPSSAS